MSHLLSHFPQRSNGHTKPLGLIPFNSRGPASRAWGSDVPPRARADGRHTDRWRGQWLVVAGWRRLAHPTSEGIGHICKQNAYFAPFVPDANGTFSAPDRHVHD
jgi:hypothetical protein